MKRNTQLNIINSTKAIAAAFVVALALTGCGGNDMLGSSISRTAMTQQDVTRDDAQTGGYCPLSAGTYSGTLTYTGTEKTCHLTMFLEATEKGLTGTLVAESGPDKATVEVEVRLEDPLALIKPVAKPIGDAKQLLELLAAPMEISLARGADEGDVEGYWIRTRYQVAIGSVTMRLMRFPIR